MISRALNWPWFSLFLQSSLCTFIWLLFTFPFLTCNHPPSSLTPIYLSFSYLTILTLPFLITLPCSYLFPTLFSFLPTIVFFHPPCLLLPHYPSHPFPYQLYSACLPLPIIPCLLPRFTYHHSPCLPFPITYFLSLPIISYTFLPFPIIPFLLPHFTNHYIPCPPLPISYSLIIFYLSFSRF